ncbi:unnamed protein product [Cylindrotheca closterium]|uniref:Dynamin N-terminal domain-containing protein n=1 Tax=Cylindrotheca closterium TaxID=2856 RepID=A0AAD2JKN1_9STRA|nr:unnamed protein product [Cylindrotheca closterium]
MTKDDPPPMKSPPTFQIKVALIGNVSAGKTTVVNALFRDKFGEVSMKRTTAGINEFAISSRNEWALVSEAPRDSHSVLKEITQDNLELRTSEEVKTKRFEIELDEALCDMRKDTQLVVVDIPGINEADMSKKYKNYVESHWNTFDCVVVVMDGRQGVNTEEQVSLLRFVKSNLESKKDVPIVILCNKIDDQDDEEQEELVLEAQREVEKIFGVPDRQKSLQEILKKCVSSKQSADSTEKQEPTDDHSKPSDQVSPVFIPISGITAFIFQTCSNMPLERFHQFDQKLIAKLGRDRIGKSRWKKLSKDERIKEAHEAVSDPEGYQEGMADSNFDKFLTVLSFLVGGKGNQQKMIQEQIRVSLSTISSGPGIVEKLETIYKTAKALPLGDAGVNPYLAEIKTTFWRLCKGMEQTCFVKNTASKYLDSFLTLTDELKKYRDFASKVGWDIEADASVAFLRRVVGRFLQNMDSTPGFAKELKAVHCAMKDVSSGSGDSLTDETLKQTFERLFHKLSEEKFAAFASADAVGNLSVLGDELVVYSKLATEAGWTSEKLKVAAKFKQLVLRQIGSLCELASNGPSQQVFGYPDSSRPASFAAFTWLDWTLVLRSILLLRYDRHFCLEFGREMVLMECLLESEPACSAEEIDEQCTRCKSKLTFNRICTRCRTPVFAKLEFRPRCFKKNCPGTTRLQDNNGLLHRCSRQHCGSCTQYNTSVNLEREKKHMCPSCVGQVLDYNRRCGNCHVFYHPHSEHATFSVCPIDRCALDASTGNCGNCGCIWKPFPNSQEGIVKLRYDGNGVVLFGSQHAVNVPSSLSDPNHFGHLAWQYCEFKATGGVEREPDSTGDNVGKPTERSGGIAACPAPFQASGMTLKKSSTYTFHVGGGGGGSGTTLPKSPSNPFVVGGAAAGTPLSKSPTKPFTFTFGSGSTTSPEQLAFGGGGSAAAADNESEPKWC